MHIILWDQATHIIENVHLWEWPVDEATTSIDIHYVPGKTLMIILLTILSPSPQYPKNNIIIIRPLQIGS